MGFHRPKVIVEFGILGGFSLMNMAAAGNNLARGPDIAAYDIFEKFEGNHAGPEIVQRFKSYPNVSIREGDFYGVYQEIPDGSVDILHVDIANDGDVYKFAVEKYMGKLRPSGLMILEGGSEERDCVDWMVRYEKPKIREFLRQNRAHNFEYVTINIFPSVTIIKAK